MNAHTKLALSSAAPAAALLLFGILGQRSELHADGEEGVNTKHAAKRVDRLVEADMAKAGLEPNALADDATFLRRTYLRTIGRIPTVEEARDFLESRDADKRRLLIDRLLESPGHASHMFNFWADLLRVKSRLNGQISGEPFAHFLKESAQKNKRYDDFGREMVTATGPVHARGNGATGMLMRDRGMPLDSMSNTVRVFLGTRLECAQCHDHPFDKWTQRDFYEMAAFTGGLRYQQNAQQSAVGDDIRKLARELRDNKDRNALRALGRMMRPVNSAITGSGTGKIRLPKDYKYDDAKPREVIAAHVLFGINPKIDYPQAKRETSRRRKRGRRAKQPKRRKRNNLNVPALDTRTRFADWLTSVENPRFTKVIANRMWKLVMGRGLIEPADNMMDTTVASNPKLMSELEKLMVDLDYDLRGFLRVLLNTQTYQREAQRSEVASDAKNFFQGPILQRMTGEQVWDSMLTLAVENVDSTIKDPALRAKRAYDRYESLVSMSADELRKVVEKEKLRYTNPQRYRAMQVAARRKQQRAQQEKQREMQAKRRRKAKDASDRRRATLRPLFRAFQKARRARDAQTMASVKAKLQQLGIEIDEKGRPKRKPKPKNMRRRRSSRGMALVRASEYAHPAPAGHFLRKFGQSDREQIQASHTEANVPQVLTLLNGFVEDRVLANKASALMKQVDAATSPREKVRTAYLGVLNRAPGGRELAMWQHEFQKSGGAATRDLIWTLVNSHEFRFIQ